MSSIGVKDEKRVEKRIRDLMRSGSRPSASQISIGLNVCPSLVAKILRRILR